MISEPSSSHTGISYNEKKNTDSCRKEVRFVREVGKINPVKGSMNS